jgi:hypothetical protein
MGVVMLVRRRSARAWAAELEAFRLLMPADLDFEAVARWLGMVAVATAVPQWSVRPPTVLGIEIRATARGIEHYLLVPRFARTSMLQIMRAGLPGARLAPAPNYLGRPLEVNFGVEFGLTTTRRPLATDRGEAVATAFLTSLQPLHGNDQVSATYFFSGAGTPKLVQSRRPRRREVELPFLVRDDRDAEAIRAHREKDGLPLLLVSARIGASSASGRQARAMTKRSAAALRGLSAPGVRIVQRLVPAGVVAGRMARRALPLKNWMLLNASELGSIIGLPVGEHFIAGLPVGASRHLPPSPNPPRHGIVLARSTYPGSSQTIAISPEDLRRHCWLLGPTGTGKSTLIANMALQDAEAGRGCIVVDPKSDLVTEFLARRPASRHRDVIMLDPAAAYADDMPVVGLNVLGQARTEHERELATDQIVYILHSLWAESWGPRTSDVLRNAILTLTHTRATDGSAFTLTEVGPLLEDHAFRRFVTAQAGVPEVVRGFWAAFERYSDVQRIQVIGPSINKLRALTTRTPLRLMLGQSVGVDLAQAINSGKIVLVPLSKGIIGPEAAQLLGSLIVAQIVGAIFSRASLPVAQRLPVTVYLDEFHEVLRLASDLPDALAQVRALGASFVLANQYMHQLPDVAKRAVMGTVRSAVVFALQDYDDARALERRFAPLTAPELMRIPAFEIAAQLSEHNAPARPVTGLTLPLPEPSTDATDLARQSAERYGLPRATIEEAMQRRIATRPPGAAKDSNVIGFGRRKLGGTE